MKVLQHTVEITGTLELNKRELELLSNLLAYDNKVLCRNVPNSYQGGVSEREMISFLAELKGNVSAVIGYINGSLERTRVRD
jgi:hypothetical protein